MRKVLLFMTGIGLVMQLSAQIKIHSHNDYAKLRPFYEALENKAFSIEADVFPVNGKLLVGHELKDLKADRTLWKMYIEPILQQFALYKGSVLQDTSYIFSLMIEIKQDPVEAFSLLEKLLKPHNKFFDRSINPKAVQIIITGNQGPVSEWGHYPSYIYFDGKPYEPYSPASFQRIAIISDNYNKYSIANGSHDSTRFVKVINDVHHCGKLIRFWGAPDNERTWMQFYLQGVDIINTDNVSACHQVFKNYEKKNKGKIKNLPVPYN
ncbi:MAG: hypothetical protein NVSMB67_28660 [Flavisolibacter sp.]